MIDLLNPRLFLQMLVMIGCGLSMPAYVQAQTPPAIGSVPVQNRATLSLTECYQLAESNYPLVRQYALIDKSKEYSISNASRAILPQLFMGGQATYQSDVTQIPVTLPNMNIPSMSKDQYKLYGEVSQSVTDLFTLRYQKDLIHAGAAVETQKLEVELHALKERINQIYFGILLIDAQIAQVEILKKDIRGGMDKNQVAIDNGIALRSSADVLRAEWLRAGQKIIELKAARKAFAEMLSLFINQPVDQETVLERPRPMVQTHTINRPELKWYELQKQTFDAQSKWIDTRVQPRFGLFLQGGYGRPALNMLKNDPEPYYIGGVRLTWNLSSFYTYKQEKQLLSLHQQAIDVQKETFLFNTGLVLKQQSNEIFKLRELLQADEEIIRLRESIRLSAQNQLEFGVATTNDYLTYLHAVDQARQDLILHEIQLLMAQYNLKATSGN